MKKLVILGAGESGVGVSLLAVKNGYDVLVSDSGKIKDGYKAVMDGAGVPWEEGGHSRDAVLSVGEVMKSPGVPDEAPVMREIIGRGVPVVSEMEFCHRFMRGRTICVTGSNGKTTTTTLIYKILRAAGKNAALGGNIGKSLAMQMASGQSDWYVLELSSFQLDNCYDFRADVAVLTNITPDHLDRYGFSMQRYTDSKMRIMQNQTEKDKFVFWAGDGTVVRELARRRAGETIPAPTPSSRPAAPGHPEEVPFEDGDFERLGLEMRMFGTHNKRNALAAFHAALAAGVDEDTVRRVIREFPGVEHRLEFVATVGGADYINDSKATNVDACRVALEAMTRPVVLVVGGTDKGNDYGSIIPLVKEKCRAVVFLGADNAKLRACFGPLGLPVADTHSMKDCVAACRSLAREGDAVLLSPCCASFDLFRNMEDRGEQFAACVRALRETAPGA